MSTTPAQQFLRDAATKSADLVHRDIIRRNMESYDTAHLKGRGRFKNWEAARSKCQEIKREAVNHLDKYLLQFEENVVAHGGHVFWAADGEEACAYITELAARHNVKTVVKSKSMVTEEIHLATALEKIGITVWETDLGEYIVQLRNEPPYHIVTPAMHLNRQQIGELFREKLGESVANDDPGQLVALASRKLRQAFFAAEMGISGANFIVADSGVVAISTNEGNGRLTTSLPRIHVAVTGIEKVIPRLEDLATLWPVLATSGTGQPITTYSTMIGGPRRPGEADGPEEFHVVLLDNGRSNLLGNAEEREVPVNINLHHHLLHNRRDTANAGGTKFSERAGFRLWRTAMLHPRLYAFGGWLTRKGLRLLYGMGLAGTVLDPMRVWSRKRTPVPLPSQSFRARWKRELERENLGKR